MKFFERFRYLRHHVRMVWPRYKLSTGDFRTGLGPSAWLLHTNTDWNDSGAEDASLPAFRRNIAAMGLEPYIEIIRADSRSAARDWTRPIDLIFIDGDHSHQGVKADWELFSPFLTASGVAVFHDTTWELHRHDDARYRPDMGVPRFVDELRRQGYPVITIDRDCGLSLVQRPTGGIPLLPAS